MKLENQVNLHQLLKEQTAELYDKAHKIPYVADFLKKKIPRISYIAHLRALAIIYGTLEHQLSMPENQEINYFVRDYTPKLPLLLSDLQVLKATGVKDIMPSVNIALIIADKILVYSKASHYKLLGFIYTLEGSLNSKSFFGHHFPGMLNFKANIETKCLSTFDSDFKKSGSDCLIKIDSGIVGSQQKEDVVSAAKEIFYDLMKIYEVLYPVDDKMLGNHITSINPEAGNYPITTNALEIIAALTAGIDCWNEFPYYEIRYGERGRRFTVSDSVWLVTLSELSEGEAIKQVNWLANLLAVRGMPTYTMEFHLRMLYSELSKQNPAEEEKYLKLLLAAEDIKNQRTAHVSETVFENSDSIFEKHLDESKITEKTCLKLKKNIGKLIAGSVADDKNEISVSKKSLADWLERKDIFPESWILAVEKTYKEIEGIINI